MSKPAGELYHVVLESGRLTGSVRVVGRLPDPMPQSDVEKLIAGLRTVSDLYKIDGKGSVHLALEGSMYPEKEKANEDRTYYTTDGIGIYSRDAGPGHPQRER